MPGLGSVYRTILDWFEDSLILHIWYNSKLLNIVNFLWKVQHELSEIGWNRIKKGTPILRLWCEYSLVCGQTRVWLIHPVRSLLLAWHTGSQWNYWRAYLVRKAEGEVRLLWNLFIFMYAVAQNDFTFHWSLLHNHENEVSSDGLEAWQTLMWIEAAHKLKRFYPWQTLLHCKIPQSEKHLYSGIKYAGNLVKSNR